MDRFFFIVMAVFAHPVLAAPISTDDIQQLSHEIAVVNEMLEIGEAHLVSDHIRTKLQSQHQIVTQYFADPDISLLDKSDLLSFSQELAEVLQALGVPAVRVDSIPTNLSQGTGSGIIRGFVRDKLSENPLENSLVSLYTSGGVYVASDYTDSIGRYAMTGLDAGQYIALASYGSSYMTTLYDGVSCQGGLGVGCQVNQATSIDVAADQIVEQINFDLDQYGQVTGRVIDQQSGDPIHASITVYDAGFNAISSASTHYNSGEYSVVLPGLGDHYLRFSSGNYQTKMYDDIPCLDEVCDLNLATAVQVGLDESLNLGDTVLVRNTFISGRVLEANTNAVINQVNRVEYYDAVNGYYMGSEYPDSDGFWVSDPLPSGTYHLRNSAYGYLAQYYDTKDCSDSGYSSCDNVNPDDLVHSGNNNTDDVNFYLQSGGVINGIIRDHNNNPASALVRLYNEQGESIRYDYSEQSGHYEFRGLGNGIYYVSAHNDQHQITLHPNILCTSVVSYYDRCETPNQGNPIVINALETETKNVRMRTGATVSGLVRDSNNNPIEGASIRLTNNQANYLGYSDASGWYEINNIRADSYHLIGSASQHASVVWPNHVCSEPGQCDPAQGTEITVSGSNSYNNLSLNLPELGLINFAVKNTSNQPVSTGSIRVYSITGTYIGSFSVNDGLAKLWLHTGNYQFYFTNSYGGYIDKIYGGANCYQNCQPGTGTAVNINIGQSKNLSMTVDRVFKIQGVITEEYPTGHNWKYIRIYQNNNLVESRKFHGNGSFEMDIRYPGPIKVEAYQEGHYSQYYQNINCHGSECGLAQATSVNVISNQSRNMDFQLNLLSHIKGRVRNQDGDPLAGIQVSAYRENSYSSISTVTDSNGNYALYGVEPGLYNLRAITDGVYESTLWGNQPCPNPCNYNSDHEIELSVGDFLNQRNITMSQRGGLSISGATYFAGGIAPDVSVAFVNQSTGYYHWYSTDHNGDIDGVSLPAGPYQILARVGDYNNYLYTAYPAESCTNPSVCLSASPVFQVNGQLSHDLDALRIHRKGVLRAELVDQLTGDPVSSAQVQILDAALNVQEYSYVNNGIGVINDIDAGSYYLYVKTGSQSSYQNELYDDVTCGRGLGIDCLLTDGVRVDFANNEEQTITFTLSKKPTLEVNLVNAYSQQPVTGEVKVFDPNGNVVLSDVSGDVIELPLNEGQYYVMGWSYNYSITAYPNASCFSEYDLDDCDLSQATLIDLAAPGTSIYLGLNLAQGINGQVIDGYTGDPIAGAVVDFWTHYGSLYVSTMTGSNGRFSQPLQHYNDYRLSTDIDSGLGLFNEVYNNRLCFDGPAVLGFCDLQEGDLVTIDPDAVQAPQIIFELHADPIFKDAFDGVN